MTISVPPELAGLARAAGVRLSHRTYEGEEQQVEPEVVLGVLRALGHPVERPADAAAALGALAAERARRRLSPVLVRRSPDHEDRAIALSGPVDPDRAWLTLEREDGGRVRARVSEVLAPGPHPGVSLARLTGSELTFGYHQLVLEESGRQDRALLVSAPRCPVPRRSWGVFLPLYALRSTSGWGIGGYGDLAELGRLAATAGGSLVGTLPLHPVFLDGPADPSPYLPVTRLGYSELYVDPAAVPELAEMPEAQRVIGSEDFLEALRAAREARSVPYELVAELQRRVFQPLADAVIEGPWRTDLRGFADSHPELVAYARFRAAGERYGRDWRRWPTSPPAEPGAESPLDAAARYHLCAQWLAWRQLAEAGQATPLYGDLPVGVHPDGFDPYFEPEAFASEAEAGAPPDPFFPLGQGWSSPPLHPEGIRNQQYRYVIESLRVAFANVACLRIDHVMGLHRLYWIPRGFDAAHGAYVNYRPDELHALVALEAHRAQAMVVGEDLGTVEPQVRETMAEERMLRSWVLEFTTTPEAPLPEPPEHCLASWGSHDVPRFAAFYRGEAPGRGLRPEHPGAEADPVVPDERARWRVALAAELVERGVKRLGPEPATGGQPPAERTALAGCLAHLARSRADLVLVDLADLWGEVEQENRPGTGLEAGNWRHRAALTLDQARSDAGVSELLDLVGRARSAGPDERVGRP